MCVLVLPIPPFTLTPSQVEVEACVREHSVTEYKQAVVIKIIENMGKKER